MIRIDKKSNKVSDDKGNRRLPCGSLVHNLQREMGGNVSRWLQHDAVDTGCQLSIKRYKITQGYSEREKTGTCLQRGFCAWDRGQLTRSRAQKRNANPIDDHSFDTTGAVFGRSEHVVVVKLVG